MKRTLYIALVCLSILVLFIRFGLKPTYSLLGYKERAGIKITSVPEAKIYLNQNQIGQTPFQDDNLTPGDYQIKLEEDQKSWQGSVRLNRGTITVINRELATSSALASGEVLTLKEGKGVVIASSPNEVNVEIDGKQFGKTPLSISDLPSGEHQFTISKEGYHKRMLQAQIPSGLGLTLDIDLAIIPSVEEVVTPPKIIITATVKGTPNGFLRVRASPSTQALEIGRVNEGDSLTIIEEVNKDWVKIQLPDGKEGYVSSSYIEKPD